MSFSFTPPQQQQQQQSLFQSPFQQSSPFQPQQQQQQQQQQQSPFQLQTPQQQQQPQPQPQPQQQQQQHQPLYLFTNDKVPATYGTKWADLHPDSQKALLQIEERILEYRDESQRLDQCSRLYDSSSANNGFELDASYVVQELGGITIAVDRQKATLQELMNVAKEMLRNTEVAVRSFMMLQPRFLNPNRAGANALSQPSGAAATQTSSGQPANSMIPVLDFYSGIPKKPSPYLQQTVARFEKDISNCRQWIEELEQLLVVDSGRHSFNSSSSLLQSLPKVMGNVHDFFVHVAAKVESIHQYIESMRTAYLADQRRRGEENNPFLEADRRETAKQEAVSRRVHPTIHLPVVPQQTGQSTGQLALPAATGASTSTNTASSTPAPALSGSGSLLFSTPVAASSTPSLFSTPSASAPFSSLLGTGAPSESSSFSSLSASSAGFGISTPLFSSTPAAGASTFSTPFGTGAAMGSGASFGTASKARAKSRSGRR